MKTVICLVSMFFIGQLSFAENKTLKLLRKIPHSGYSEGLDFHEGYLWNSTPESIIKIDPADGSVIAKYKPATTYSESLMWFQGSLWNLSFANNGIYKGKITGDELKFTRVAKMPEIHGWGITNNGKEIILTGDYSDKIYFMDPKTLTIKRTVSAHKKTGEKVSSLEDNAFDGKYLWDSSFDSYRGQIFRIHPDSGLVEDFYDLPVKEDCPIIDGIAFDGKNLWVTGKHCPGIYYLERPTK